MQVGNYFANGKRWWVRLQEKGGKRHEMPAHHKLEQFLDEYLDAAGITDRDKTPLPLGGGQNRTIDGPTDAPRRRLSDGTSAHRRGRLEGKAGLPRVSRDRHHRLPRCRGTLENAQAMAAHESPRTTKLYDRTGDGITLDEVERINI
jgi:hypothetical protein